MNGFRITLAAAVSLLPFTAMAQNVPAIQANASASASIGAGSVPTIAGGQQGQAKPPAGWPPLTATIHAPAIALDKKESTAVNLSTKWRNKSDKPIIDSDGVLRWVFGNSQTRVVCSPYNISDIELKPGETVNNIRLGDTGFWTVTLAISGSSEGRVTHVAITPREAGREASMLVYTDQRTYAIKLVSTGANYTARTGFSYPESGESAQDTLAAYHAAVGNAGSATIFNASEVGSIANIEFLTISGDKPSWRPLDAYTDGRKTYIRFPKDMQFGDSPTLLGVNADGGWFSSPTERRVIYRWMGNKLIADTVMDKLELILGVGGSQQRVVLSRQK